DGSPWDSVKALNARGVTEKEGARRREADRDRVAPFGRRVRRIAMVTGASGRPGGAGVGTRGPAGRRSGHPEARGAGRAGPQPAGSEADRSALLGTARAPRGSDYHTPRPPAQPSRAADEA